MLNFGLKHCHSSGWHKKFPRHKIDREDPKHLGMHEHLRLRNEWFEGRQGFLSRKEINKFLEANLGKNVDTVFSEFVKRAKHYKHDSNLRKAFFEQLDPDLRWSRKGYVLDKQNKIVRYKGKEEKRISNKEAQSFNEVMYPYNITQYLKETEVTYIGDFYLRTKHWNWIKAPVYVCSKEWYNLVLTYGVGKRYIKMNNMVRIHIHFNKYIGVGVPKNGYENRSIPTGNTIYIGGFETQEYKNVKYSYTTTDWTADYIFLTKREEGCNWSEY